MNSHPDPESFRDRDLLHYGFNRITKDPLTSLPARSRDACSPYKTLEGVASAKARLGVTVGVGLTL